ncbi:MAG: isochorismatase family protein [Dehalococcoidia bacterium]|nr:isochorismatase family protein [Dehalococcoidia bacterium]
MPDAERYNERTALVVVDVQNDFADPSGGLYVQGGETIIERVNEEVAAARAAGAFVVYTQDWHPESTPHFQKDGGVWPVHCVMDTWGAELHPDLHIQGDVLRKGTGGEDGYSGFTVRDPESGAEAPTALERMLRERGVERIVVVGLAADVCVKATALDGRATGLATTVLRDATRGVGVEPGDTERAFAALEGAGVTVE